MKSIKKVSVIMLSIALVMSLTAMPVMAEEETEVRIVASEELMENAEPEVKTVAEETTVIEQAAEKVQEVIEEVIETVRETAETVKEEIIEIREKAEEEAVHAQMEIDASIPEEDEEYYNVSTVVFTEDGMLILPRPVKKGKVFIEWNTEEDGSGYSYKAGEIVDPTDIVLYSIWEDEIEEEEVKAEKKTIVNDADTEGTEIVNDVEAEGTEIVNDVEEDAEVKEEIVTEAPAEKKEEAAPEEKEAEPEGAAEETAEPEIEAAEEGAEE